MAFPIQIDKSIWPGPAGAVGKWNIFLLYTFAFFFKSEEKLKDRGAPIGQGLLSNREKNAKV